MNNLLASLKKTVREAWVTLSQLPDLDARFRRGLGFGWVFQVIRDAGESYGWTPASCRGTPEKISEAEVVFEWLAWLRREAPPEGGDAAINRIGTWALGAPLWQMAQRERCSEMTIYNRIDRSIAKILTEFIEDAIDEKTEGVLLPMAADAAQIAAINEPETQRESIRGFGERSIGESPDSLEPGKVFIAGVGMMFRGEKYRSALDLDERNWGKRRK